MEEVIETSAEEGSENGNSAESHQDAAPVTTPRRFAFPRAQRRRLQRLVVKGIQAKRRRERSSRKQPQYSRATRRAVWRKAARAAKKQVHTLQRQMPMFCPRCQQPYLGKSNWRCACKIERDVEFAPAL
jgi:hypothetical protein